MESVLAPKVILSCRMVPKYLYWLIVSTSISLIKVLAVTVGFRQKSISISGVLVALSCIYDSSLLSNKCENTTQELRTILKKSSADGMDFKTTKLSAPYVFILLDSQHHQKWGHGPSEVTLLGPNWLTSSAKTESDLSGLHTPFTCLKFPDWWKASFFWLRVFLRELAT